ncbi:MAG: hypothetical protein KDE09_07725 [Anaerolineales bacterium]|nr:hypothetical protein [Anaerolineales bacterium]MCB8963004.1 hypothetical protein [Ardenticatenales bacterium]MCB0005154.1 hypothetical protein [Anaerolineales bacterium]MCB0011971.1 hypothetical protein [Anaerolineales bacterium]MCB0017663.1 hypothetical protein [Anaerolineales bacterium]
MPIEIRELVIRATVQDDEAPADADTQAATSLDEEAVEKIVAECVRQVLEILARKDER